MITFMRNDKSMYIQYKVTSLRTSKEKKVIDFCLLSQFIKNSSYHFSKEKRKE